EATGNLRTGGDGSAGAVVSEENELGTGSPSDADTIAVGERTLGNFDPIQQRSSSRTAIADRVPPVTRDNLGVLARDIDAAQDEIAGRTSPDREDLLVDGDETPAQRIDDFKARL